MLLPATTFALEPGEGRARAIDKETVHLLHARLSSSATLSVLCPRQARVARNTYIE
jgi:hypothetical protein